MENFRVHKSKPLEGSVKVNSAKNAVLKVIVATLLADGKHVLENVPNLSDVRVLADILRYIGSDVDYNPATGKMIINTKIERCNPPYELMTKMRASFNVLGALIARRGHAHVFLPGGCQIGTRPVELHLKGLRELGCEVVLDHGCVQATAHTLKGKHMFLDYPSVGATENIMMAALFAEGVTIIENAAQEPEVVDLSNYLNQMGAKITGVGTSRIKITGVKQLNPSTYSGIPDRIEAGTYMIAAAITRGKITINNVIVEHMIPIISKLREAGVKIETGTDYIKVDATGKLNKINIQTLPYPGFPTDLQSQMLAFMTTLDGNSQVKETVFENRLMISNELIKMGAQISVEGNRAFVTGTEKLAGAKVEALDLRSGIALILAGLIAEGETEVYNIHHIDRGFTNLEEKFKALGADIIRN